MKIDYITTTYTFKAFKNCNNCLITLRPLEKEKKITPLVWKISKLNTWIERGGGGKERDRTERGGWRLKQNINTLLLFSASLKKHYSKKKYWAIYYPSSSLKTNKIRKLKGYISYWPSECVLPFSGLIFLLAMKYPHWQLLCPCSDLFHCNIEGKKYAKSYCDVGKRIGLIFIYSLPRGWLYHWVIVKKSLRLWKGILCKINLKKNSY